MTRAQRVARVAHTALGAALASVIFTATFAASVILHGDLPATRRLVARTSTAALATLFRGRIVVKAIDRIGFSGVDVAEAEVLDPTGRRVIAARGVHVRASLPAIASGVLAPAGPRVVSLPEIRIEDADVLLDRMPESSELRIEAAFTPPPKPPPKVPPKPPVAPPREIRVEMPLIQIDHVHTEGEPTPGLPLDADLSRVPGAVTVRSSGVVVDVGRAGVAFRSLAPAKPNGTAEYHLRLVAGDPVPLRMWAGFTGDLGDVPVSATARLDGQVVEGALEAPRVTPEDLARLVPGVPLKAPASLSVRVTGRLPDLRVVARAVAGASEVAVDAKVALDARPLRISGSVLARDVDPRLFDPAAPAASLGGDATFRMELPDSGPVADVDATSFPFTLGDHVVPGASVRARYEAREVSGRAEVYEPGATTRGSFRVDRTGTFTFDAESNVPSFARVPRLRGALEGRGRVRAKGEIGPRGLAIDVDASVAGLGKGGTRVGSAAVRGRVFGKPAALFVDGEVAGRGVEIAGLTVERATARATGPLTDPFVSVRADDPRFSQLSVAGSVHLAGGPSVSGVRAKLVRSDVETTVNVGAVELRPGAVALRKLSVGGDAATVSGDVVISGAGLRADVDGQLDLAKLERLFPGIGTTKGTVTFRAKVEGAGERRTGSIAVALRDGQLFALPLRLIGDGTVSLDGAAVRSDWKARLEGDDGGLLASLAADGDVEVRGDLLRASSWSAATGTARIGELTVDLDEIFRQSLVKIAANALPELPKLGGKVTLKAAAHRADRAAVPDLGLLVQTEGLSATWGARTRRGLPTIVGGIDLSATVSATHLEASEGEEPARRERMLVAFAGRASTGPAPLATVAAYTNLGGRDLVSHIVALARGDAATRAHALAAIQKLPLTARATWADRPIASWPDVMRPQGLEGSVHASVELGGSIGDPAARMVARVAGFAATVPGMEAWPLDATITGRIEGGDLLVTAASEHESVKVAELQLTGDVPLGDLLWRRKGAERWKVGGTVVFDRFRLESIPWLATRGVAGAASGTIHADDLHDNPYFEASLAFDDARFFDAPIARGTVAGWIREGAGVVTAELSQQPPAGETRGGRLQITALPTVSFRDKLVPELDATRPQTFAARVERFEVEPLAPLTAPVLADLRGLLDGEATLTLTARPGDAKGTSLASLSGELRWTDGVVLIPQIGQSFTNGSLHLKTIAQQDTIWFQVPNLSVSGTTGRVKGWATLALPTDYLAAALLGDQKGMARLRRRIEGQAVLDIEERERVPITFEGVPLGDAYGFAEAALSVEDDGVHIEVGIPQLTFELPETEARAVQDLSEPADIGVVDREHGRRRRRRAPDVTPVIVSIGIGRQLPQVGDPGDQRSGSVVVRRSGLDVQLVGEAVATFGEELVMRGMVQTVTGRVLALGKRFDVEQGFIRFDEAESPDNPYLNLRAGWTAPDGTRVYAELVGYFDDAKLRLRSEPPRPESEVLSLVLFGRTSDTAQLPGQQRTSEGVAAGAGAASTLLNQLLDPVEVFGRRLEARVDTSSAAGTRVGVATEIRPNLWAQVDVNTARQQQFRHDYYDVSSVTLDWRFRQKWSLRTTVGNRGSTTVEVVWQHRY